VRTKHEADTNFLRHQPPCPALDRGGVTLLPKVPSIKSNWTLAAEVDRTNAINSRHGYHRGEIPHVVDTLQLAPGTESYVQVQAVPNWEIGSAGGASFTVLSMSPQEAQSYLPTMTNLGQR
jgi:hypothetical protein